ncbi:MAG: hypothetical protein KBA75_01910 [Alphaproteobacteria bacterium]|nr:hypothetical protein [Alphaproteobacteria bacterium]
MPYDFKAAMRGAVLNGSKPMQEFVAILYGFDRLQARGSGQADPDGFRAQHAQARHRLSQPHGLTAPTLNWIAAGKLICDTAKSLLRTTPDIDPETALRQVVHGVNKGEMTLQLNRGGHLRLG